MTQTLRSINPATQRIIKEYRPYSSSQCHRLIGQAKEAQQKWALLDIATRVRQLGVIAKTLREQQAELATLITCEMGKLLSESTAEIKKCAWLCEVMFENAHTYLADSNHIETDEQQAFVCYEPLGLILGVMPWNFPFWQVFRFAIPALLAGNAVVLKHASNVSGCALAIEKLFSNQANLKGLFTTLLIDSSAVNAVIAMPEISAVTLTGSEAAGQAVAAHAGQCLKKVVLELGGSDPYIILDDATIETAVDICVKSRLLNAGQSCIAAKRFIIADSIYDDVVYAMVNAMKSRVPGLPEQSNTTLAPMVSIEARDHLHQQVERSIAQGANCLIGGKIPEGEGAFYPATLLDGVIPGMPAFDEELFGPVGALIRAQTLDEALRLANQTSYGLGAALFSADIVKATDIARKRLQAGCCAINSMVQSNPYLPFGGIKNSGFGRELGKMGLHEFVNVKTISVAKI